MRAPVLAAVLACATSHVMAQGSISIITVDRPSAATLALITINGNGFDAANAAISVVFTARDAIAVTVPAISATANSLQVAVPPLISAANGELFDTPVVADLQVVQATRSNIMTSNVLGGLTIEPAPTTTEPPGTITRAFLRTILEIQADMRTAHRASAGFGDVLTASQAFSDAQAPLVEAIEAIIANAEQTVTLPTVDDLPLSISARTLRATDRFALAFVEQANAAALLRGGLARPAVEVPAGCDTCANPKTKADRDLCQFRSNPCAAYDVSKKVVPELAASVYAAEFGFLAGWAAGGLAGAGVMASETAAGLSFLAAQAVSYGTAVLAGVDAPGAWSLLRDSGATVLDEYSQNGLGIFGGLNAGIGLGQIMDTVVTSTRGRVATAPQGGVVLPAPRPTNPPANTRPTFVYQAGAATRWVTTATTQQVAALVTATVPAPTVARFDGSYGGASSVSCTVATPDGPVTVGASAGIAASVANGVLSAGGGGVGTVSSKGRFTAPTTGAGGISCSVGGRFWFDENGRAGASGFEACSGAGARCSGTWGLQRPQQ